MATIGKERWPLDDDLKRTIDASTTGVHQIVGLAMPGAMTVEQCEEYLRDKLTSILARCFDGRSYIIRGFSDVGPVVSFTLPEEDEDAKQVTMTAIVVLADVYQARVGDLCVIGDVSPAILDARQRERGNGSTPTSIKWEFVTMKHGFLRVR